MERYEKYKDSGVEWIGEVPEHWEVKRLKFICRLQSGNNIVSEQISDSGEFPVFGGNGLRGYFNAYTHEGAFILIGRQGAYCGNIKYANGKFWASEHAIVVSPIMEYENTYVGSLLEIMNLNQYSMSAAQPGLAVELIKNLNVLFPPLEEQIIISSYLDRKTAEIDQLIADKKRLITLYEEEKTALINQAVTKGINPDVKMKDSGIEWLGEVPEHWEVKKLRYLGSCQNGISKSADSFGKGFPFLSYSDVYRNPETPTKLDGLVESNDKERQGCSVEEGDVFFTRTSETMEEIGIASTCMESIPDAVFAGFLIRFRPTSDKLTKGFSKFFFRAQIHRRYFVKEMNLVTRASLSQELLKKLPVLVPPIEEQHLIVRHIEAHCARIDAKKIQALHAMSLLAEYRTALISEVVTGKIKVA